MSTFGTASTGSAVHAERFFETLGQELPADELARLLRAYVQSLRAPVVGAMRISCSDETEQEMLSSFQRHFVRYLLPDLKLAAKSPFRSANLGGRYEWGAAPVAEQHYAVAKGADDGKVLVVKVNSHVAVDERVDMPTFGVGSRYGGESPFCGALEAVVEGSEAPFALRLRDELDFEGVDRLSVLRDPRRVPRPLRSLFTAVLNARIQARRVMLDVQDHAPNSPTLYLILACVTLNRAGHDTEIPVGLYRCDRRSEADARAPGADEYRGLSDWPERYRLDGSLGRFSLSDRAGFEPRPARNHRALIRGRVGPIRTADEASSEHLEGALGRARDALARREVHGPVLKTLLAALAATSPVPAALLLFGEGMVHIHHAAKAHRLAQEAEDDPAARRMLAEIEARVGSLSPEEASHLTELLLRAYGK